MKRSRAAAVGVGLAALGVALAHVGAAKASEPPVAGLYRDVGDPRPAWPLLRVGSAGDEVVEWQRALQAFVPGSLPRFGVDGKFGAETEAATLSFQRDANAFNKRNALPAIKVDGIVGPETRTAWARRAKERREAPRATLLEGVSPLPGIIPDMPPRAPLPPSVRRAADMVRNLLTSRPGTENRELVRAFQAERGLKPSGFYNVESALALIGEGFVPPTPYYWGRGGVREKRRRYRARLVEQSERQPHRAKEWLGAAKMVMS